MHKVIMLIATLAFLSGCQNTVQGMRDDIHDATGPDTSPKVVVTKKTTTTTVVTPDSPPPIN